VCSSLADDYYYAHKYNIIFDKLVKDSSIANEAWNELQELGTMAANPLFSFLFLLLSSFCCN
jgi:hypothetical protein